MRRRWLLGLFLMLVVVGCALPGQSRPHESVGARADRLRSAFNADDGEVRLVALVSPTCGTCLRGATDMQRVLAGQHDPRLRAYIVWVPKLGAREGNVAEATRTVEDQRASHYWDGAGYLIHVYDRVLGLGQDAWDVYLIYGPSARWDGALPPAPAVWMHQLGGGVAGNHLDVTAFAHQVASELQGPS
jgi:hypothetical protein